jgi:EAL domain-containing protein (putative c-di-GMP-specific phosphodiesterase class I)
MIEITESLAINDINKIIDILSSIKQIGVKIAMDDFGTGYSSLNHLRRLPLNLVKFDRSFIFNIEYDPYTVSFVDTISKFCHMKDMHVCCEGVETSTQKILLQSIGVDNLQGYLFGKPMTADDFLALFSNAQSE